MSEYHDVEGNPISLYKLVRKEPDWAASIIKFSNEKIPELEKRIAELEAKIPKWVPVSERLPEKGRQSKVYSDPAFIAYTFNGTNYTGEGRYCTNGKWMDVFGEVVRVFAENASRCRCQMRRRWIDGIHTKN